MWEICRWHRNNTFIEFEVDKHVVPRLAAPIGASISATALKPNLKANSQY
jgi:hypothetical protein